MSVSTPSESHPRISSFIVSVRTFSGGSSKTVATQTKASSRVIRTSRNYWHRKIVKECALLNHFFDRAFDLGKVHEQQHGCAHASLLHHTASPQPGLENLWTAALNRVSCKRERPHRPPHAVAIDDRH